MKILVADDRPDTREMFKLAFRMDGHEAKLASNGVEAVEAVRIEPFDAIIMDVEMPVMDGWDAVRQIRTLDNGTRSIIILFSAFADCHDRQRAAEVGANSILCKPMLSREVLAKIEKLVAMQEQKEEDDPVARLGSMELGLITVIPPDGQAMTLQEYAAARAEDVEDGSRATSGRDENM